MQEFNWKLINDTTRLDLYDNAASIVKYVLKMKDLHFGVCFP